MSFLENVDMLPCCDVLVVQSTSTSHCSIPSLLHLLRSSTGVKKFVVYLEFNRILCYSIVLKTSNNL